MPRRFAVFEDEPVAATEGEEAVAGEPTPVPTYRITTIVSMSDVLRFLYKARQWEVG